MSNNLSEFELIERYFRRSAPRATVGPGDDCALFTPNVGMELAVSTDMLIEGRHFLPTIDPKKLGHKALAVNLSDLAACGARPLGFTLALALPRADTAWLEAFAQGLLQLADTHGCELIGGDTTAGPLNICITVFGETPLQGALLRSGAQPQDDIWVSGHLGDARLALEIIRGHTAAENASLRECRFALEQPQPRIALGIALLGVATAAIDLSDGLVGDIHHVLQKSRVNAVINADALPRSAELTAQPLALQRLCTLSGGDDYELLFTAPAQRRADVFAAAQEAQTAVTRVGYIEARRQEAATSALSLIDAQGNPLAGGPWIAFDHFKKSP